MAPPHSFGELTPHAIGERIAQAIEEAPEPYRGNRTLVAGSIRRSTDTLDNYINGKTEVGAVTIWKLSQLTGKPFSWFAGSDDDGDTGGKLDRDIRRLLISQKQQRMRELKEIDALLGI
jgi:hypothetical protein